MSDQSQTYPLATPDHAPVPEKRKPRWGFIILGSVVLVVAVVGFIWWFVHRDQQGTDDAFVDGRAVTLAPRVAGNIVALLVNDNQFVKAGQELARIGPRDFIAARDQAQGALLSQQAQLDDAQANLAITQLTQPAKLAQAQAQLSSARATQVKAAADFRRFHAIDPAATTKQDVDQATATNNQALAQVAQAQAAVAQAQTVNLDVRQAQAKVDQLRGEVISAQAKLDQANLNISYTSIVAPQDGWITQRNVEMGNYVQVGTALFSIVTPDVWVTANFKEDELTRMRVGQKVHIRVDAYPDLKLEGHVDSVQLGSGSKFSTFPAENATGNFVKIVQRVPVKIVIDSGMDANVPLPLGISVEPTVELK